MLRIFGVDFVRLLPYSLLTSNHLIATRGPIIPSMRRINISQRTKEK